jgi:hypothetical protein
LKQEKLQYFVHKTAAALARQQQPPTRSTGFNNRSIGRATASTTLHTAMATTTNAALLGQQRHHCEQQCYNNHSIALPCPTHGNSISGEFTCQSQSKDQ